MYHSPVQLCRQWPPQVRLPVGDMEYVDSILCNAYRKLYLEEGMGELGS